MIGYCFWKRPDATPGHGNARRALPPLFVIAAVLSMCLGGASRARAGGDWGAHVAYDKSAGAESGGYLVGGHLELRPAPLFGVEAAVDYRSSEQFAANDILPGPVKMRSLPVTLSGKLYLPSPGGLTPYLLGGAGWYRVVYDYSEPLQNELGRSSDSVSSFGWHLGLGTNVSLAPAVILGLEARYVFLDPRGKLDEQIQQQMRNLDYDAVDLRAGVSFVF